MDAQLLLIRDQLFLIPNRGIQNERLFSAQQFRCTLQSKLGAGPLEDPPDKEFTCQCTAKYCPRDDPFHGCHCNINASFRLRRHNEIQRVLKKKCLGLPEQAVHLEAFASTTALVAPKRETLWIEVSVVDPRCHHYIQGYRSYEVPDAAAEAMETSKRSHHSAVRDPVPLPPASVIPFVLETSERLRPSALGFIQRVSGAHTYLMFQLLKEITFICGRMLETKFELMRANPHK